MSSPDLPRPLAGQLVVFTGKLNLLGRKEAQALVTSLGGATGNDVNTQTTMLVVGAAGSGPQPQGALDAELQQKSNKLRRAEAINAQQSQQIRIITEEDFCRLAGVASVDRLKQQHYALRDLVHRYPSTREDELRYLVKVGLLGPVVRTNTDILFRFQDLSVIRQLNEALAQGMAFRSFVRALLAARQGQLALDFRLDAAPAKIIALRKAVRKPAVRETPLGEQDRTRAEALFLAASEMDTGDAATVDAAAANYRRALEIDPYLTPALINLANIHYSRSELAEAQALYERSIGLESDFFEAHFNLGNIYHDLGRYREAQTCYREALRLNPRYANAHFYLAVTFEKMGRSDQARPHWRAYRELAPDGEWVDLAREFSE